MAATRGTSILGCVGLKGAFPATHSLSQGGKLVLMCTVFLFLASLRRQHCVAPSLMVALNGNVLVL